MKSIKTATRGISSLRVHLKWIILCRISVKLQSGWNRGENSWGLLFLLSACLLFCSHRVQDLFPPAPSCSSEEEEGQLNKQREHRERQTHSFSLSVPRNLSKLINLGPLALWASGCWVSVTDEKKCAGIWDRPHATDEPAWEGEIGRRSGSGLDWPSDWLAEIKKEQQTDVWTHQRGFGCLEECKSETLSSTQSSTLE